MIDRHFARDPISKDRLPDDALAALEAAMLTSRQNAERAGRATAAILRNEMMTMPARQRQAKNDSWKLFEQASKKLDAARAKATETAAALRESIAAPRRRVDASTVFVDSEVRARLAAMSPADRRAALSEAVRLGDEQIVAAVLAGPAMLTGLADRAEREEFRVQWQTKACAPELDRIARIEKALADADRAHSLLLTYTASLTDAEMIARAEELEREAQAALAG